MHKFQFFLFVEALLVTLSFITILSSNVASFVVLLVLALLTWRFYTDSSHAHLLLTISLVVLLLMFIINPYTVLAILFAVGYTLINHFSQVKKMNRYALLESPLEVRHTPQQWLGNRHYQAQNRYAFDDINVIRISGTDSIDLSKVIIRGHANVVIIRKVYGPTRLLVPLDVAVTLDVASIYGSVSFFDYPDYDLRNETIKFRQTDTEQLPKSVKIIITTIAGSVEVRRI